MEEFDITVTKHKIGTKGAKIAVIGVGGAGGNMLDTIAKSDISEDVKLVAANTDAQALDGCSAATKILLGPNVTKGQGAGSGRRISGCRGRARERGHGALIKAARFSPVEALAYT